LKALLCGADQFYGGSGKLTSLDVSNNTALVWLECQNNQLQSLDVSKNKALSILNCDNNQLSDVTLNALFGSLHDINYLTYSDEFIIRTFGINYKKDIKIGNNPGTATCDRSIAEDKGWTVND